MNDIHCFECSDVLQAARALVWDKKKPLEENQKRAALMSEVTSFLPAPKTWIEFKDPERRNTRWGVLMQEDAGFATFTVGAA